MEKRTKSQNELLSRKYYEYDDAFYSKKIKLSCIDQAKYQSLRDWEMDYFLVFCEDINIKFSARLESMYLRTHYLNYNKGLCEYECVTTDKEAAEGCIKHILDNGRIVVFRTAMDYLHTYVWYHADEPYTRIRHRSVLVGYDENNYFYVDVPPTRNPQFFMPHPDNEAVGIISRKELLHSFQYFCEVGYMKVNSKYINKIADVNSIIRGVKQNFYHVNNKENDIYVGKQALELLAKTLKTDYDKIPFELDEFIFELLASRHEILKINLQEHENFLKEKEQEECIDLLDKLADKWRIIKNLIIKNDIFYQRNTGRIISDILEKQIIPLTEELMSCFET